MNERSDEILSRLPHRPPFLFVSDVVRLDETEGTATWFVAADESFLAGHFPGRPIVPGVLITEALAQLSGLVACSNETSKGTDGRLAQINIRFDGSAIPPVEIKLVSRLTRVLGTLQQFEVLAEVAGQAVASGTLTLAILEGPPSE